MTNFSLQIKGLDSLRRLANALEEDFTQALNLNGTEQEIAKAISEQNRQQFEAESDFEGRRWKALSEEYEKRKRQIVGVKPILEFRGLLRRSLEDPQVSLDDNGRRLLVRYVGEHSELIEIQAAQGRRAGGLSQATREEIQSIAFRKVSENFSERLKRRRVR